MRLDVFTTLHSLCYRPIIAFERADRVYGWVAAIKPDHSTSGSPVMIGYSGFHLSDVPFSSLWLRRMDLVLRLCGASSSLLPTDSFALAALMRHSDSSSVQFTLP